MPDRDQIAARVRELLAQVLDIPASSIDLNFSADSSPAWTSLNHLMLVSQIEAEYEVTFSSQEIRILTSFSTLVDTLVRHLESGD